MKPIRVRFYWAELQYSPGARFSKAPVTFWARQAIFSPSVSKNEKCIGLKILVWRDLLFKLRICESKQLCNRKVQDFAMALRARKVSGTQSRNGPAPGPGCSNGG